MFLFLLASLTCRTLNQAAFSSRVLRYLWKQSDRLIFLDWAKQALHICCCHQTTLQKIVSQNLMWPICFLDSAGSISCVRRGTASSRSPSSTISVFLHHLLAPPSIICFLLYLLQNLFLPRSVLPPFIRPIFPSTQLNLDGCCNLADIDVWKGEVVRW